MKLKCLLINNRIIMSLVCAALVAGCGSDETPATTVGGGTVDSIGGNDAQVGFGDASAGDDTGGPSDVAAGGDSATTDGSTTADTATTPDTTIPVDTASADDAAVGNDTTSTDDAAVDHDAATTGDTTADGAGGDDGASTGDGAGGDAKTPPPGTCKDRCDKYDGKEKCQCDSGCTGYGDCCADYEELCKPKGADCKNDAECDDKNGCTVDTCIAGKCESKPTTAACDDADPCTLDDACSAGKCAGSPKPCDDHDPCTTDSCDAQTGCVNKPADGAACDDGDKCLENKKCAQGKCGGGTQKSCDDGDTCTTDSCDSGAGCIQKATEGSCDDGDACTAGDACKGGKCTGAAKDCADDDPCTDDLCDAKTAACAHSPAANGSPCSDSDKCTDKDACEAGKCAGKPKNCDDGSVCTADKCDAVTGNCDHATTGDGGVSDDGNPCTDADKCAAGKCKGTGKDCDDNNACTVDTCDGATKNCSHSPATEGGKCDDGDKCTVDEVCKTGACTGAAKSCDDGSSCTKDSCNAADGTCTHQGDADGGACDDGDPCTSTDACKASKCVGTKLCDDNNVCTDDSCDPQTGACNAKPVAASTACDDGNKCTEKDTCSAGQCLGAAKTCSDGEPCTADSCNAQTGACSNDKLKDGELCDDGNACTQAETCKGGACSGGKDVCTFKPLHTDKFDCGKAGDWTMDPAAAEPEIAWHVDATPKTPAPHSATCSLNLNNGTDYAGTTRIVASATGKPLAIPAHDHARMRFWSYHGMETSNNFDKRWVEISADGFTGKVQSVQLDNALAFRFKWVELEVDMDAWLGRTVQVRFRFDSVDTEQNTTAGWFVDDMVIETGSTPGTCAGRCGTLDAAASCQCDSKCATAGNCCADYKALCTGCTTDDQCGDGNPCTTDSCDKNSGACVSKAVTTGAPCDDGSACTVKDACLNGQCAGTQDSCGDGNDCTWDFCDKLKGCQHNDATGKCEDGDKCTANDTCNAGKCTTGAAACDDGNSCTTDSCDAADGKCTHLNLGDGSACEDGNKCTSFDICSAGKCIAGQSKCEDGNACTDDACAAATGACTYKNLANGTACEDGNNCTAGTVCAAGKCAGKDVCAYTAQLQETFECDKAVGWAMAPSNKEPATGWHVDGTANPPGYHSAKCSLNFNNGKDFSNGAELAKGHATSPALSLPANGHARMSFWSFHGVESHNSYDHRRVLISDDGFKQSIQTVRLDNLVSYNQWVKVDVSLALWLGKKIQVRFDFDSADEQFNTRAGWFIDDLLVESGGVDEGTSCSGRCGGFVAGAKCQCDATCAQFGTCCGDYKAICTGCKTDAQCGDGNPCTTDKCDTKTGSCSSIVASNGVACSDGNACSVNDACKDGKCRGAKKACADGNACTFDSCDPQKGCTFPSNSDTCDDGDACTSESFCNNGQCVGFKQKCDDGKACTTDSCDAKTGACKNVNRPDGASCAAGDACIIGAKCSAGTCKGVAKDCNDGNQCTADSCNKTTGQCANELLAEGSACEDGNFCTANDTCAKGACSGAEVCKYASKLDAAFDCGKASGFTIAPVPAAGKVGWVVDGTPNPPGYKSSSCSLNFNDGTDYAQVPAVRVMGTATSGTAKLDASGHARLTLWSYNGVEKQAAFDLRTIMVSDDGFKKRVQAWRLDNLKDAGKWTQATFDLDGWLGKTVQVRFAFDSVDAYDNGGKGWFVDDVKIEFGAVKAKTCKNDSNCADGNTCTVDTCDKDGNCVNSYAKSDAECDDGEVCSWDSCDKQKGCQHAPADVACDDGNQCTENDACKAGKCAGGSLKGCDDKNACTTDACDPKAGGCKYEAKKDGDLCSDGDICTQKDACAKGKCEGATPKCDDGNACTTDSCNSTTGACGVVTVANGGKCDDGDACSGDDACQAGVCSGKQVCTDQSPVFNEAFACGNTDWTITPKPAAGQVGWAIDGTPNPPGHKSASCSLNINNGKDFNAAAKVVGQATSKPIAIPAGKGAEIAFWSYNGVEDHASYDNRYVEVSDDDFAKNVRSVRLDNGANVGKWVELKVRIDEFVDKTVKIRFRFDSGDTFKNDGKGWFVDDVKVYGKK